MDTFTISAINRNFDGNPNIVFIVSSANLSTITTAGYLTNENTNIEQLNNGSFQWENTDIVLISYAPNFLINWFTRDATNNTFVLNSSGGGSGATPTQVQQLAFNYGTDTGTADNYIVDLTPAVTSLTDGLIVAFTPLNANTSGSPSITINGLTGNTIQNFDSNNQSLIAGQLSNTQLAFLMYSATAGVFLLLNPALSTYADSTFVQKSNYNRGADTGTADNYVVSVNPAIGFISNGTIVMFTPAHTSLTTTPTLNCSSDGPITMTSANASVPLSAGAIATTQLCMCVYSAAANKFLVLTPAA